MKEKRKKRIIAIVAAVILLILIVLIILSESNTSNQLEKELSKDGYTTENNEDSFYKKVITNNTLDDYYQDIANNNNSEYEEYYFAKESYDFIELKMTYQNEENKVINITSNLKNFETNYNFELSYQNTYLLIEGNNTDDYSCHIIRNNNISEEDINNYCKEVKKEIQQYESRKEELLKNEKIREIVG